MWNILYHQRIPPFTRANKLQPQNCISNLHSKIITCLDSGRDRVQNFGLNPWAKLCLGKMLSPLPPYRNLMRARNPWERYGISLRKLQFEGKLTRHTNHPSSISTCCKDTFRSRPFFLTDFQLDALEISQRGMIVKGLSHLFTFAHSCIPKS